MIVGMDFGTTNSGMAVYDGHQLRLVPLDPANTNPYVARTAMYITNDRAVHIGRDATDTYYEQNLNRPFKLERVRVGEVELTFAEIGTFIRDVYIEKDIYAPGRLFLSFKMGLSSPDYLGTVVGDSYYFLEDIIAIYLYTTKKRAETFLQTALDTIVIGRPVRYADDEQHNGLARERMLQAAFRAGYKRVYLQYEPIAAAYHYETQISKEQNVLVFDFGGGTLDISIMRLGNPKTRSVLATGGIPVAGDVFDRKIVRSKFPAHFGEGETYRHGDRQLPVPSSYFQAFNNWQELLTLQFPDKLDNLKYIADNSSSPRKLNGLINLITSHYGLKMFDAAEQTKRQVSNKPFATLGLDGPGFSVHDSLSKVEFERLIRPDVRAIADRLDTVIKEAGLKPDQIDAVIRTGGSSQIPVFIDMLTERFDSTKVLDLDAFSSVTSGLGVLGHEIEEGRADLRLHTPDDHPPAEYLQAEDEGGIPVIDLDLMKQFVELREERETDEQQHLVLSAQTENRYLRTAVIDSPDAATFTDDLTASPAILTNDSDQIVMMTSEFRVVVKTVAQLEDLNAVGMSVEESEKFEADAFGRETVTGLASWNSINGATCTAMVTSRGYGRVYLGEGFVDKLTQPIPYVMHRAKGFPAALVDVTDAEELLLFSNTGRAVRFPVEAISTHDQRLLNISPDGYLVGAVAIREPGEFIVATASGYAKRVQRSQIEIADTVNPSGTKIVNRTEPVAILKYRPGKTLYAVTSHRIATIDASTIPVLNNKTTSHKPLKLKKHEHLVTLTYL